MTHSSGATVNLDSLALAPCVTVDHTTASSGWRRDRRRWCADHAKRVFADELLSGKVNIMLVAAVPGAPQSQIALRT